jgi:hypothetical protein
LHLNPDPDRGSEFPIPVLIRIHKITESESRIQSGSGYGSGYGSGTTTLVLIAYCDIVAGWGIAFGDTVLEGELSFGPGQDLVVASGAPLVRFPPDGLLVAGGTALRNQGEEVLGGSGSGGGAGAADGGASGQYPILGTYQVPVHITLICFILNQVPMFNRSNLCCGSGIRCFFTHGIRNEFFPDPESGPFFW